MASPEEFNIASAVVDHPAQPGWILNGLEIVKCYAGEPVPAPFERFGNDAMSVVDAFNVASRRTDSARATHEQHNVAKLLLTEEEHEQYLKLAGNPVHALKYMTWFGQRSSSAFTHMTYMMNVEGYENRLNRGRKASKIGVELFGQRQAGNWDTRVVDNLARKIPEILQDHAGAEIAIYDDPEHPRILGYYFIPLYYRDGEGGENFAFGTVRRRRMLADVVLDGVKIELFKEATALVPLKYVSNVVRQEITQNYATPELRKESDKRNSIPAKLAGLVLANAISRKDDALVVPMSIQDIMMVRAPHTTQTYLTSILAKAA